MSIPQNLKTIRSKMRLSQEAFAAGMGVSRDLINQYEQAKALPRIDFLLKLSYLSGMHLEQLLYTVLHEDDLPIDMDFSNLRNSEDSARNQTNLFDVRNMIQEIESLRKDLEELKKLHRDKTQ